MLFSDRKSAKHCCFDADSAPLKMAGINLCSLTLASHSIGQERHSPCCGTDFLNSSLSQTKPNLALAYLALKKATFSRSDITFTNKNTSTYKYYHQKSETRGNVHWMLMENLPKESVVHPST